MIWHAFDKSTGEFINSIEYPENRIPSNENNIYLNSILPDANGKKIVLINEKIQILTEKEFTLHKISLGIMQLNHSQKVSEDGKIVNKTEIENLESMSQLEAFQYCYNYFSQEASRKINSGFESEATGKKLVYDTTLYDQLNLENIRSLHIDFELRCYNPITKIKTFLPHSASQITKIHNDFLQFKNAILVKADQKKNNLTRLFEQGKTTKELLEFIKS